MRSPSRHHARRRPLVALVIAAGLALAASPLHAQGNGDQPSDEERAAAQVLFDEGRDLLENERWEPACEKFAESMRLDRALGTQLNLANCYEHIGKTASAWINYVEAASRAAKAGQPRRVKIAKERAAALEPTLARLRIEVPSEVAGLAIKRDGVEVGSAQHNVPVPVDPGVHRIEVSAPGKRTWRKKISVTASETAEVAVPPLRDAPVVVEPDPVTPATVSDGSGMRAAGYVIGGVGVAGLVVGIVGGALAISRNDSSLKRCLPDDVTRCNEDGASLRADAFDMSYVSTAGFAVAGAGFVTALVLLVAAPSGDAEPGSGDDAEAARADTALRWQIAPLFDEDAGRPSGLLIQGAF